MDERTTKELGALLAMCRAVPKSAASMATAAAVRAEAAAVLAEQHNMGVSVSGTKIVFSEAAEVSSDE